LKSIARAEYLTDLVSLNFLLAKAAEDSSQREGCWSFNVSNQSLDNVDMRAQFHEPFIDHKGHWLRRLRAHNIQEHYCCAERHTKASPYSAVLVLMTQG
jgi:hypothetical protein